MNAGPSKHIIGRYMLHGEIASGGMATVYFGRLMGDGGFSRVVAIKRLHPQFVSDDDFRAMFLDEARLCARVRHPNVVSILDVVELGGELFLVMEYVQGETFSRLMRAARSVEGALPMEMVASIMSGVLDGLHGAHEACSEAGQPLGIVHRDVSPQNIIVGVDGVARVVDFGVAKAAGRLSTTRDGQLKGKMAYMSPEQLSGHVDRRTDVYAAAVVLWEALARRRLFDGDQEAVVFGQVLNMPIPPPSQFAPGIPPALDAVVLHGLARDPDQRFQTALEMAMAIEEAVPLAPQRQVGQRVQHLAQAALQKRNVRFAEIESVPSANILPSELLSSPSSPTHPDLSRPSLSQPGVTPPGPSSRGVSQPGVDPRSASQLTNLSMSGQVRAGSEPRSRAGLVAAIVALGLVLVGTVGAIIVFSTRDSSASRDQQPTAAVAAAPAPPSAAASAAPAATEAPPAPQPTATAAAETAPAARPEAKKPSPPRPAAGAARPAAPKPADCNPPYTLDAQGVRIPKPQCL